MAPSGATQQQKKAEEIPAPSGATKQQKKKFRHHRVQPNNTKHDKKNSPHRLGGGCEAPTTKGIARRIPHLGWEEGAKHQQQEAQQEERNRPTSVGSAGLDYFQSRNAVKEVCMTGVLLTEHTTKNGPPKNPTTVGRKRVRL